MELNYDFYRILNVCNSCKIEKEERQLCGIRMFPHIAQENYSEYNGELSPVQVWA
jgi:hypothetical protein